MTTTISTSPRSSSRPRSVEIRCSTRRDGDFNAARVDAHTLAERRRAFIELPWAVPHHMHGTEIVAVTETSDRTGTGDIVITDLDDVVLACWVADCAPIVLVGDRQLAVVHAGWRGLAAGVIDVAVGAFDESVRGAFIGPVIHPCCYEFGVDDLAAVAAAVHSGPDTVSGATRCGGLALDMPAAVAAACAHHGIETTAIAGCTGCDYDGFSHRVRGESQRHVVAAWRPSRVAG